VVLQVVVIWSASGTIRFYAPASSLGPPIGASVLGGVLQVATRADVSAVVFVYGELPLTMLAKELGIAYA
jgi:hypothetical protein